MASITKETKKVEEPLSTQYGGIHAHGWVSRLPPSWIPYVQLSRLSPPAALLLIWFPHLFGALHAAIQLNLSYWELSRVSLLLLGGSAFYSNAAHAWNDLIDAPIDRRVSRTKKRPIVRGAITPRAAFIFTITQAIGAAAFLPCFTQDTLYATIPSICAATYYPYAKRHTHFAQFVLGFALSWGTMVGCAAAGLQRPWTDPSAIALTAAFSLWAVIYDTIYAYQDIMDDLQIGVKSLAILFGSRTKELLLVVLTVMGALLLVYGRLAGLGFLFHFIALGGCLANLGTMIVSVSLKDGSNCWWWFSTGNLYTGMAVAAGLFFEYMLRAALPTV